MFCLLLQSVYLCMASAGSGVLNACINCRGARPPNSRFGARRRTACGALRAARACCSETRELYQRSIPGARAEFSSQPALLRSRRLRPRCLLGIVVSNCLFGSRRDSLCSKSWRQALPAAGGKVVGCFSHPGPDNCAFDMYVALERLFNCFSELKKHI